MLSPHIHFQKLNSWISLKSVEENLLVHKTSQPQHLFYNYLLFACARKDM